MQQSFLNHWTSSKEGQWFWEKIKQNKKKQRWFSTNASYYYLKKVSRMWYMECKSTQRPVNFLGWESRYKSLQEQRQLEFTGKSVRDKRSAKREMFWGIYRGPLSNIQLSTNQCRHVRRLPKSMKEINPNIRGNMCKAHIGYTH